MTCNTLKEVIYKGRNNTNQVTIYEDDVALDLSAVTRYVLYLPTPDFTIDTAVETGSITGNASGLLTFDFSGVDLSSITEGEYYARLVAYDPSHSLGQVLIHEDDTKLHDRLLLSFRDA